MADFTVFYGSQLYGEYTATAYAENRLNVPDGAFILYPSKNWYMKRFGGLTPINLCDLSSEVRTICLLMGIPV